jgi:hypothetical protein
LFGDVPGLDQFLPASKIGLGEFQLALARSDLGLRRRQRVIRVLDIGLRGAQLRLVFRRGQLRDRLALRDAGPSSTVTSESRPAYFEETSSWVASMRPFDLTMPSGSVCPRKRAIRFRTMP